MFAVSSMAFKPGQNWHGAWHGYVAVSTSVYLEYEFGSGTGNMLI